MENNELTLINLIPKGTLSFKAILKKVSAYVNSTNTITIAGALRSAGLNYASFNKLLRMQAEGKSLSDDETKTIKLFEELKTIIAEYLEGQIIYQKTKFFNHNQAAWMLKKLYPEIFGDKVETLITPTQSKYSFDKDLKNESGITLLDNSKYKVS